ncbi:MAG: alpha/beta hydrolase [Patescibacteria group bacterium]|nr:alpha/beta hydrolase [Patescibacteria group bacterium]
MKFAWKNPSKVLKLILTGTPLQRDRSFSKKIAFVASKTAGKVLKLLPNGINNLARKSIYKAIGEWDYFKAGDLREIFKNIIEEEPIKYFKEIKIPVFLIWGKDDKTVPPEEVKQIANISKAHFITIPNTDHKLPYMNPDLFCKSLEKVL